MNKNTTNDKYMRVIEGLGELLLNKDETIQFNEYEIKSLKNKIEQIEQYIEFYKKKASERTNKQSV